MRTIKITLGYDGTHFAGWQWQPRERTIQGEFMDALEKITGARTHADASGRTDSGVHAAAQIVSFRTESPIPCENLVKALNGVLPHSIRVYSAEEAAEDFHARFQAVAKTYRYFLYRGAVCPPHRWPYVHHFPYPLDLAAMQQAARHFAGEHDFTSLASTQEVPEGSRVRTLFSSEWATSGDEWTYSARGSGFLHHMVRNLVGTMLEVGKGNMPPAAIPKVLAALDRSAAGPTAPAKGLWLISVEYPT